MNEVNRKLVADVLAAIRTHESDGWDQQVFVSECGTRFCFAGWALRLGGYGVKTEQYRSLDRGDGIDVKRSWFVAPGGEELRSPDGWGSTNLNIIAAVRLLGGRASDWEPVIYSGTVSVDKLEELVMGVVDKIERRAARARTMIKN